MFWIIVNKIFNVFRKSFIFRVFTSIILERGDGILHFFSFLHAQSRAVVSVFVYFLPVFRGRSRIRKPVENCKFFTSFPKRHVQFFTSFDVSSFLQVFINRNLQPSTIQARTCQTCRCCCGIPTTSPKEPSRKPVENLQKTCRNL